MVKTWPGGHALERRRKSSLSPFFLLLLLGCSTARPPRIGEPGPTVPDASEEKLWSDLVDRFTDRKAIYDGLDTRVFMAATWQSPQFYQARVKRELEFQAAPAEEFGAALKAESARLNDITEFTLGVNFNDYRYEDFDKPGSIWRLTLVVGDAELTPLEVHRVGKANLARRALYPYLDTFWVEYVVRFRKVAVPPGAKLVLRVASSLGRAELEFHAE
jgi:hypothetical protein